jgi:hypothetical protein
VLRDDGKGKRKGHVLRSCFDRNCELSSYNIRQISSMIEHVKETWICFHLEDP